MNTINNYIPYFKPIAQAVDRRKDAIALPLHNCSISFEGLESNIKMARTTVNAFHREFGGLHSESFLSLKKYKHKADEKFVDVIAKLNPVIKKYTDELNSLLYKQYTEMFTTYLPKTKRIEKLELYVKETHAANCDQQAEILKHRFEQNGVHVRNLNFRILNKADDSERVCGGHSFNVIGMSRKADILNPATWGRNAVIADSWADIKEPAEIGLKYLKEIFAFNPETEYIIFENKDLLLKDLYGKISALHSYCNWKAKVGRD